MIEKIALSKNPVEATATMVAALATSSRLGNQNQRKLLLELTKKVSLCLYLLKITYFVKHTNLRYGPLSKDVCL